MEKFEKHIVALWDNFRGFDQNKGHRDWNLFVKNGFLPKGQNCKVLKTISISVDFLFELYIIVNLNTFFFCCGLYTKMNKKFSLS